MAYEDISGLVPLGVLICMTSGGALWFQSAPMFDETSLYLVVLEAGLTAEVEYGDKNRLQVTRFRLQGQKSRL